MASKLPKKNIPVAKSHEVLDRDEAVQEEVRTVARAVLEAISELRSNRLSIRDKGLQRTAQNK